MKKNSTVLFIALMMLSGMGAAAQQKFQDALYRNNAAPASGTAKELASKTDSLIAKTLEINILQPTDTLRFYIPKEKLTVYYDPRDFLYDNTPLTWTEIDRLFWAGPYAYYGPYGVFSPYGRYGFGHYGFRPYGYYGYGYGYGLGFGSYYDYYDLISWNLGLDSLYPWWSAYYSMYDPWMMGGYDPWFYGNPWHSHFCENRPMYGSYYPAHVNHDVDHGSVSSSKENKPAGSPRSRAAVVSANPSSGGSVRAVSSSARTSGVSSESTRSSVSASTFSRATASASTPAVRSVAASTPSSAPASRSTATTTSPTSRSGAVSTYVRSSGSEYHSVSATSSESRSSYSSGSSYRSSGSSSYSSGSSGGYSGGHSSGGGSSSGGSSHSGGSGGGGRR